MSKDIKFSDIKTINFNSPSKNLVNVEPNIVHIPASDECGSGINLDWYKAYSLYVPELPLGINWITLYFNRYPDFLNPQSITHFHEDGEQFYEMRYGEKISNTTISNLDGYEGGSISFDSMTANGNIRASVSPARVKTYELTLASLPEGVESYTVTRTPGLTGAAATESFTVPGTSGKPIIYYGDTLTVSIVAKPGFNPATSSFSNLTNDRVVGPSTLTVTSGGPKQFSLKVSGFGTQLEEGCGDPYNTTEGLTLIKVEVTSSPYANKTGVTDVQYDGTITVYYGDTLKATVYTSESHNGYLNWTTYEVGNAQPTELIATVAIKTFTVEFKPNDSSWGSVSTSKIEKVPYGSYIQVDENNIITIEGFSTTVTASSTIDTAQYDYEFTGWLNVTGLITSDRIITADFTQTVKNYTITIAKNNSSYGTISQTSIIVPYGTTWVADNSSKKITLSYNNTIITATEATDTAQYNYSFVNWTWSSSTAEVKGDVTITANFKRELQKYTVSYPAIVDHVATFKIYHNGVEKVTNPTVADSFEVNYGEKVYAVATPETGYKNPSIGGVGTSEVLATPIWSNTNITLRAGSVEDYTIYISGLDEIDNETCQDIIYESNINYVTVTRTASPLAGAAIGEIITATINSSFTAYYGDELTITAVPDTGYKISSLNYPTLKVTSGATIQVAATLETYKLTIGTKPTGVSTHTVSRTSSPYGNGVTGQLANNATLYYGDILTASATAHEAYTAPSLNWTSISKVTDNVNSTVTAGTVKQYTLTISSLPEGVSSLIVTRTSSPYKSAATGKLKNGAIIYYGDVLTASATASNAYYNPSLNWTSIEKVTGNVTATATSGGVKYFDFGISGFDTYYDDCNNPLNGNLDINSITVQVTSSPYAGATKTEVFTNDSSMRVYYGDTLKATISVATGYNGSLTWTSIAPVSSAPSELIGTATIKTFTVTFVTNNEYGSIDKTSITKVPYDSSISVSDNKVTINGTTVTATEDPDTAQYDYSFTGWSNTSGSVIADRVITANFGVETQYYTITIARNNTAYGTVSQSSVSVPYGTTWTTSGNKLTISGIANPITATETTDTAQYDYVFSSWSAASGTVTGNVTITANFNRVVRTYTVSYPAKPSGVNSFIIYLDGIAKVTNPTVADSFEVNYGAKVYATGSGTEVYNNPSIFGISTSSTLPTTVSSNVNITVTRGSVKTYDIDVSGFYYAEYDSCGDIIAEHGSEHLTSITISRSSSQYGDGSTGVLKTLNANGTVTVYYGDIITASAVTSTGYQPNLSWTNKTITGYTTLSAAPSLKTYTLTIVNGSYGTVKRGSTTLSNGATITHFDTLTITPTAATGYTTTASPTGTLTVDGNETVTFTRTGNTYYVYYKQGNASNTTGLPSTQSRIYPNAVTLATNSMTKSNTTATGASIIYAAGLSNGGTLPSATTATDTISYTKDGWTTSSTATNTKNYADGANFGGSSTTNLTLYPNFKTSKSYGSVTVATNSRTKTSTSEGSYYVYYNAGTATHSYETDSCGDVHEVSPITPSFQRSYNTISYSANGWTTGSSNLNDRDYTNGQTLNNFSSALTLYPNFTTSSANGGVTLASNTNLYRTDDLVNSYTVTYNQGNASSTTNLPSQQTSKNKIVYTANGWTTTSGSTSRTYADGAKTSALTANLTLYPCFSQTVTNQGITLSSNTMSKSNTTASGYTVTYKQGSASSATNLPSAQTQTNTTTYTHGGWATSASGSKAYNKGAAISALSANLILYPYFSSSTTNGTIKLGTNSMTKSNTIDSSYTVTYNYNGSGAANTTATATKTRSYTANGWTTTSGSTTRNYTNGQTITPTANITLYPCFSQSTSGGSVTLPTPTRSGHTFNGWYTAASGGTKIGAGGASYTPSANITLYAQWTVSTTWHTILSSSITITTTSELGKTYNISGLKENTLTRITFSGDISNDAGFSDNTISQRTNAESSNGVYSGSGHQSGNNGYGYEADYDFGFSLVMYNGYIKFTPYVNGDWYNECGDSGTVDLYRGVVTITNIQQYY